MPRRGNLLFYIITYKQSVTAISVNQSGPKSGPEFKSKALWIPSPSWSWRTLHRTAAESLFTTFEKLALEGAEFASSVRNFFTPQKNRIIGS